MSIRSALLGGLFLAGIFLAGESCAADIVGTSDIIQRLTPAKRPHRTRSIAIEPTGDEQTGPAADAAPSIDLDILFDFNSDRLTTQATGQLSALGAALASTELGGFRFEVAGHTDAVGAAAYNLGLSERRAAAVKQYLTQVHGIDPGRLAASGWGSARLKNPAEPANPENRRVEVRNLGQLVSGPENRP